MELNEYQVKAMTTCTKSCRNFSYMMLNLVGEVGELASKVAKAIRKKEAYVGQTDALYPDSDLYYNPDLLDDLDYNDRMRHLKLEAGDILWQLSGLCNVMGWKLEDVAQANLDKLASRQERCKIIGDGDDR